MTRAEALEVVRAQVEFARRQAENPYNNSRKEIHVRELFRGMAAVLEEAVATLEGGSRAKRTSRPA